MSLVELSERSIIFQPYLYFYVKALYFRRLVVVVNQRCFLAKKNFLRVVVDELSDLASEIATVFRESINCKIHATNIFD